MNSNYSTQLCRLCLDNRADLLNIFQQFEDSTVASVLATHFWFQIDKDEGSMPEWVCETCWTHTKTFHHFFKRLELRHRKNLSSIVLVKVDEIKRERSVTPVEGALETDFIVVKYEEQTETAETTEDTQILSKESNCNEDKSCNHSEADDGSLGKPIKGHNSRSEVEDHDAEICRFFEMTCEICNDVKFETLEEVRKHYRDVHKTKGYLTCCGKKYTKRCLMLDHIQYHMNPEAHPCEQCGKGFPTKRALRSHARIHAPLTLKCESCFKFYSTAAALKCHVRDRHATDPSVKFHCDICGKSYPTKSILFRHIKAYHERTHVCDGCGRKFRSKTDMTFHIEIEHSTTPPPKVQCDICGAWLKHKRSLRFHLKIHQDQQDAQDGNAEVVSCPICKKKVQYKRLLAVHIRTTHGERKYQCTFCDKAFRTARRLREHTALHTGEDLYSCAYCEKTFKSGANLHKHRKQSHSEEITRDKARKLELS